MENNYDYNNLSENDKDAIKIIAAYNDRKFYNKNIKYIIISTLLGYSFATDASILFNLNKSGSGNNLLYTAAGTSIVLILTCLIKYAKNKKELKQLLHLFNEMNLKDITIADLEKYLDSYNKSTNNNRKNDKFAITKARKYQKYQKENTKLLKKVDKINNEIKNTNNIREKHDLVNERARIEDLMHDNLIKKYKLTNNNRETEKLGTRK